MIAKKTYKNQITLPKKIISEFKNIDYFDIRIEDNKIVLTPVEITPVNITIENIRGKIQKLRLNEKDINDAVKWARKKKI